MKKLYLGLIASICLSYSAFSQCTPANVKATNTINTPGYTLNSSFNSSTTATATIANLSSGMLSFTGTVSGTARWGLGVQIQNDPTVGNYIFVQPNTTTPVASNATNAATYTFQFAEAVTNFSLRCAGLNNNDQLRVTAFNGATPITITASNFSNIVDEDASGTIVVSGNTVIGNNTGGGTGVTTNRVTLTIPGPVTQIVIYSGKGNTGNTSTVTLGFTSMSYTRCVKVPPDINATFVNGTVTGNVGTNDVKPTGTTYGSATAQGGNPSADLPTINSDGSYTFTPTAVGVYKFSVPMCPGSVTSPDCPLIDLIITVTTNNTATNNPFANTDMATTPINTAVILNTLSNDKAGNNTPQVLNPASVTVTVVPAHGTTSVNTTNGNITYTPTAGYTGYDILTYRVSDNSAVPKSATAYQIITILPASSANSTVAADDFNSTRLNTAVSGSIKTNDSDPESNTQTVTAQNTTVVNKGTLVLATDGSYTFTPASGFTGSVNFPYTTCDNGSPVACTNATLYLLVYPSSVMPLDLISFAATADNANTKIVWITANQDNVNRFEIERSSYNGGIFTVVGKIAANNSISGSYSFTDVNAKASIDKGFYRLKMIDNDGRFTYSRIALVNFGTTLATTIRPTVVTAGQPVTLYTGASNQRSYIGSVYNAAGRLVQQWNGTSGSYRTIETGNLAKGVYLIRVINEGRVTTEKFVVK